MRFRLLALPPALALAAGCSWFSASLEVRVRLPEPPEHWLRAFPELAFELASPQANPPRVGGPARSLEVLRLPRRANWPVLAYPWARGVRLPPAGGLYPLDLAADGETLELSWEHGPAAEVLLWLAREGFDVSLVNGQRLLTEMLARSSGDPGSLDLGHLAVRLASGEFRVTDIRLLPSRELSLEVSPGTWFLDAPLRCAQALGPGQALLLQAVPLGRHRLFAVDLPAAFDLFVSEQEVLLVALVPPPQSATLRKRALMATMIVLKDMNTAPSAGLSRMPSPESTPAARGMATTL